MGRVSVRWTLLGCLAVLGPAHAGAQTSYDPEMGISGPIVWNLGGMLVVPLSDSADRTDVGGGFNVGFTFNPAVAWGVQFEYGLAWSSLDTGSLEGAGIDGNALLQYFDLNLVARPFVSPRTTIYLVGGGGLYYREAEITRFEGTVAAPYCDPWLFYCSVVPVSAVSVLGSRSEWDWGLNAGVGVSFGISPPVRLYFEVRYHYLFGPSFTDVNGNERSADGQFLPLTLGVRF